MLGEMKVANVRGGVKEEAEYAAGELGQGLVEPRPSKGRPWGGGMEMKEGELGLGLGL